MSEKRDKYVNILNRNIGYWRRSALYDCINNRKSHIDTDCYIPYCQL